MKIALDVATKMGVAFLKGSEIVTTVYQGTAQEQMESLLDTLGDDLQGMVFYVEKLNSFVNANTTRALLLRTGYIAGTIEKRGGKVEFVIATQARKAQGVKTKLEAQALFPGLTPDEADAVVVLLYGLQAKAGDFKVYSIKGE